MLLQDNYPYESGEEAGKKVGVCVRNIEGMSAEPVSSRRWGITFVSATGLPLGTPKVFADKVNKPLPSSRPPHPIHIDIYLRAKPLLPYHLYCEE